MLLEYFLGVVSILKRKKSWTRSFTEAFTLLALIQNVYNFHVCRQLMESGSSSLPQHCVIGSLDITWHLYGFITGTPHWIHNVLLLGCDLFLLIITNRLEDVRRDFFVEFSQLWHPLQLEQEPGCSLGLVNVWAITVIYPHQDQCWTDLVLLASTEMSL